MTRLSNENDKNIEDNILFLIKYKVRKIILKTEETANCIRTMG